MDVTSAANQLPEPEELLEEGGGEDDATALRHTGRTLEVHLRTSTRKMRHRSRSSTTRLVAQEGGALLPVSDPCVVVAVVEIKGVDGVPAEVVTPPVVLNAAAEGLEDEEIGADGGTGKRCAS